MLELEGKRLLVLGGTVSTYDVVSHAKELGAYVIVTDYLDGGVSKEIADESYTISTSDLDALEQLVISKQIDGIFTGCSEVNIRFVQELCARMKMPFYATPEQFAVSMNKKRFKEQGYKIPTVIPIVLYTGKRKWKKLSINDIEETIEGYQENWLEYTLIDANKFSKEKLLEDNLIISKAMLIEKSKNKEELYKNIEDIINIQKEKNTFDNLQLEKLIKYELSETEDKNIMNEFIEKIRNVEGRDKIMTNASRIINREIRKQRKAGLEQGFKQGTIQIAKKLKREMSIKDISRITGLTEQEIENL